MAAFVALAAALLEPAVDVAAAASSSLALEVAVSSEAAFDFANLCPPSPAC